MGSSTDWVNLEVDLKGNGLLDAGGAIKNGAAGTAVGIGVARRGLRNWNRGGSCVGESEEEREE